MLKNPTKINKESALTPAHQRDRACYPILQRLFIFYHQNLDTAPAFLIQTGLNEVQPNPIVAKLAAFRS